MKRIILISSLLIVSLSIFSKQPNIVLFFIDDLGWKDAGFMGSDFYETPNIDKMAKEGMVFTNAYSSAANCAPSRACLVSGQYTPRHGKTSVWHSKRGKEEQMRLEPVPDVELDSTNYSIAQMMKDAGYKTGIFGKWHINGSPSAYGFDVDGETLPCSKAYFKETNDPKEIFGLTERACNFMEENAKEPFFLYLPHHAVHKQWMARQEDLNYFTGKQSGELHDISLYAANLKHVDESLGLIMDKLKELGIDDNTLVIFTSDNGAVNNGSAQKPLKGCKGMLYEAGIRVPFVARYPSVINASTVSEIPITNIDFYPTFADFANYKIPKDKIVDGESMAPVLKGKKENLKRDAIFFHYPNYIDGNNSDSRDKYFRLRPTTVIRIGDWKLLLFHEEWVLDGGASRIASNNAVELYNLKDDLKESKNLANVNPEKRDALLNELLAWMKKTDAKMAMVRTEENRVAPYKRGKGKH